MQFESCYAVNRKAVHLPLDGSYIQSHQVYAKLLAAVFPTHDTYGENRKIDKGTHHYK